MKEFKNNEELIEYLISKNLIINDKEQELRNIEKYSYYSIINSYKNIFKDKDNNYKISYSKYYCRKIWGFGLFKARQFWWKC